MNVQPTGTTKDLLPDLVKDNIVLQSQLKAIKSVLKVLIANFSQDEDCSPELDTSLLDELYKKAVLYNGETEISNHAWIKEDLKSMIRFDLIDVPELSFK